MLIVASRGTRTLYHLNFNARPTRPNQTDGDTPDMPLYLLKRPDKDIGYDEYCGFVVRAPDEGSARFIVSNSTGCEGGMTWMDTTKSSCELIDPNGEDGLILESFNAG